MLQYPNFRWRNLNRKSIQLWVNFAKLFYMIPNQPLVSKHFWEMSISSIKWMFVLVIVGDWSLPNVSDRISQLLLVARVWQANDKPKRDLVPLWCVYVGWPLLRTVKLFSSINFSMLAPLLSVRGLPHRVFFEFKSPTIIELGVKAVACRLVTMSWSREVYKLATVI